MERGKKTRGRQKIEIKRIEDDETRLVTFSKRKAGIFKKASELANLCGAYVGVVIFSPAGKPFAFGSPSIEAVTNRFLGENNQVAGIVDNRQPDDPRIAAIIEAQRQRRLEDLNNRHNELLLKLQAAKEKNKSLKQIAGAIKRGNARDNVKPEWWETPFDEASPAELDNMAVRMDQFYECLRSYQAKEVGSSSAAANCADLPGAP